MESPESSRQRVRSCAASGADGVTCKQSATPPHGKGRVLPPSYRHYCHGYAVTSHASQGKTVDEVAVVASTAFFVAVNREQFYVSISRGRERCEIFTDDKEALADRIGCSRQRVAALELAHALRKAGYAGKEPEISEPKAKLPHPAISAGQI